MSLKNHIDKKTKRQLFYNSLTPGQIVHLFSKYIINPDDKFCVIVHVDPFVVFYVNSNINDYVQKRPYLKDKQIKLSSGYYKFFTHDSYIDCSKLEFKITLKEFIDQVMARNGYYGIRQLLRQNELKKIVKVVTKYKGFSPIEKTMIRENFGTSEK